MKKVLAAAAIMAGVMALTGCSESILTSGDSSDNNSSAVENIWTAGDEDIVAWATAEGLSNEDKEYYNIKFKDFYSEYSFTIANYGIDENNSAYKEYAERYRENIITMLSNEKIILKKAEELGLSDLSDQEMKEIEEKYLKNLDTWYQNFESKAQTELGLESSDESGTEDSAVQSQIREKATQLFRSYIADYGISEETFLEWQTKTFIQTKVLDYIYKDINVTDQQVEDYVNKLIDEARETYEKSVADYEANSDYTSVWIPENTREIKYIFMGIPSADSAEISAARTESGADQAEVDAMRDEKLAEIKDKAEAAYKKATADGADFDAVVKEYSNDYNEADAGKTIRINYKTTKLADGLYDAIFGLEKPGDISELIPTDRGYYIIKYISDSEITEDDMKKVKENARLGIEEGLKTEKANAAIEEWQKQVGYEFDYDKLNFTKQENTKDDNSGSDSSADSN